MTDPLQIDGSQGEGGGQLLRICLSLAALTGRPFELHQIRAGRSRPGLRPQHLMAVLASAAICDAELHGAILNSQFLSFSPRTPPQSGHYRFDVADVAPAGSAGSVTLILQTLLWPLIFAGTPSTIELHGGTHVPHSPSFHYLNHVARPAFNRFGVTFAVELQQWGWYPRGQGAIRAAISPVQSLAAATFTSGPINEVGGVAVVTNLPAHIPQRMSQRAASLLRDAGITPRIQPLRERGPSPGAGLFLHIPGAGFEALGRPGLPAEQVAESAIAQCLAFIENKSAIGPYLADQLLLPAALAHGQTRFATSILTQHTVTVAGLLRQWLDIDIEIEGRQQESARISLTGIGLSGQAAG